MRTSSLSNLCPLAALPEAKPLQDADFKVLVQQKVLCEAIDHGDDVAPADRTADWSAVIDRPAAGRGQRRRDIEKLVTGARDREAVPAVIKVRYLAVAHRRSDQWVSRSAFRAATTSRPSRLRAQVYDDDA